MGCGGARVGQVFCWRALVSAATSEGVIWEDLLVRPLVCVWTSWGPT